MFEYKITVDKLGVDFVATKGKATHKQSLSHGDAPESLRKVFSNITENQEEEEMLYQAVKMFEARTITVSNK